MTTLTNVAAHPPFRGARLSGGSGTTGGDGVLLTPIPWGQIDFNDDDYVLTLNGFRIPVGLAGRYRIRAVVGVNAANNVSRWHARLRISAGGLVGSDIIHNAAGLAADLIEQTLDAEINGADLAEGALVIADLRGTYLPAVAADFTWSGLAFELHYQGRS